MGSRVGTEPRSGRRRGWRERAKTGRDGEGAPGVGVGKGDGSLEPGLPECEAGPPATPAPPARANKVARRRDGVRGVALKFKLSPSNC